MNQITLLLTPASSSCFQYKNKSGRVCSFFFFLMMNSAGEVLKHLTTLINHFTTRRGSTKLSVIQSIWAAQLFFSFTHTLLKHEEFVISNLFYEFSFAHTAMLYCKKKNTILVYSLFVFSPVTLSK